MERRRLTASLACSLGCSEKDPEAYAYNKAIKAFVEGVCFGDIRASRVVPARWGGALMIHIPKFHIDKDSQDPMKTTPETLKYFLSRGADLETFSIGYNVVGFWSTNEEEWLLSIRSYDLFKSLGLMPAHFKVEPL
jgi:hypothetical protein